MKVVKILAIVVISIFVLGFFKNILAQTALQAGLSKAIHVPVGISNTDLNLLAPSIGLKGLKIFNPKGFHEKIMVNAPEIFIHLDAAALQKGKAHFREIRVHLKELVVIKNKDGKLNVNALKPQSKESEQKKAAGKSPELLIDKLVLTIDKVVYKDYSAGDKNPQIQTFEVGINGREYRNVQNPAALSSLIMFEALTRTSLARLTDLDLSAFKDTASSALFGGLGIAKEGAEEVKNTAKNLLNLFN